MTALSVFDITDAMADQLWPVRKPVRPVSREVQLVRGHVRPRSTTRWRDGYGVPLNRPRQSCVRCGNRFKASNPQADAGGNCRDCVDVSMGVDVQDLVNQIRVTESCGDVQGAATLAWELADALADAGIVA